MRKLIKIKILLILVLTTNYFTAFSEELKFIYPSLDEIRPRVALVLSGGGARGIAQVGALEILEQKQVPYDYIVGTSIGSIIGGLVASGYSPFELDSIINSINWNDIFSLKEQNNRTDLFLDQKLIEDRSLVTFRFKNFRFIIPEAISAGDQFNITLQRVFWNSLYKPKDSFDNLKIPFRAVATDIASGQSISQKSGNLITAIRASATIPLRYTPIRTNGYVLVDGGIFANIPVEQALEFSPDIIIAVNTVSPKLNIDELNTPWNIADQVITISMDKFTQKHIEKADFIIKPEIGRHKNTDFTFLDTLIEAGRKSAEQIIPEITSFYENKFLKKISEMHSNLNPEQFQNKTLIVDNFDHVDSFLIVSTIQNIKYIDEYNKIIKLILETDRYLQVSVTIDTEKVVFRAKQFPVLNSLNLTGATSHVISVFAENYVKNNPKIQLSKKGIQKIKDDLLRQYRNLGYSYAVITAERVDANGNVFFNIDEGTIGEIKIYGNEETSDFLIQRELKFKVGDIINVNKLVRGWNNLVKTGLFSNVEINVEENPINLRKIIHIKVTEGGTQTLRIGGKIDSERFGQISLDAIQENLFNAGIRLSARSLIGTRNQDYSFWIENSRIFKTNFSFSAGMYYSIRNINEFVFNKYSKYHFKFNKTGENIVERYGGVAIFGRQLEKNGTISATYRLEKQRFYKRNTEKPDFVNISTIKIATIYDSEDRSFFAKSGQYIELSLETGALSIEPSVSFSKAYFYYHHNLLYRDLIIRPIVYFGAADKTLPQSDFFSLGGENSFYGLREDALRGRQIFRTSLETRLKLPFKIYFDTYISTRYDLGSVWLQPDEIEFNDLKHGLGFSLELDTPLGPAKLSTGKSFYFTKTRDIILGRATLYFSIGMRL